MWKYTLYGAISLTCQFDLLFAYINGTAHYAGRVESLVYTLTVV